MQAWAHQDGISDQELNHRTSICEIVNGPPNTGMSQHTLTRIMDIVIEHDNRGDPFSGMIYCFQPKYYPMDKVQRGLARTRASVSATSTAQQQSKTTSITHPTASPS